jgi:predicted polyphosphate/ATP-dependent NAD kinase
MKKQNNISTLTQLPKLAAKIKISAKLNTVADTTFFKKKMEKGAKILAVAGLPK